MPMPTYKPDIIFPDSAARHPLIFKDLGYDIPNQRDISPMSFGQYIFFAQGSFDMFCAWAKMTINNTTYYAKALDTYYFELAHVLSQIYSPNLILNLITETYNLIPIRTPDNKIIPTPQQEHVLHIHKISQALNKNNHSNWCVNMLMHLYYGMIAEENKKNTILGKSIKLTGVHSLLVRNKSISEAANENRGKSVAQILEQQQAYGIQYPAQKRPIPVPILAHI